MSIKYKFFYKYYIFVNNLHSLRFNTSIFMKIKKIDLFKFKVDIYIYTNMITKK